MFSEQEYIYGWFFYLVSVFVFMICWWHYTKLIPNKETRRLLRTMLFVMMVVPWYVNQDMTFLAPAWIIAGSEAIFQGPKAFWRAGIPLFFVMGVVLVISLIIEVTLYFSTHGREARET